MATVLVGAPPAEAGAPTGCVTSPRLLTSCTFVYTGSWQEWQAPAGVTDATFVVVGAAGGSTPGRPGGSGGGVTSRLSLSPGETVRLYVGGRGGSDTDASSGLGGWNGGGNGAGSNNPGGAGGGGASDVRTFPYSLADRVLVGGGGGGAGSSVTYAATAHGLPGAGGSGGDLGDGHQGTNVSGADVGAGGGGGATPSGGGGGGGASAGSLYNGCGTWDPGWPVAGTAGAGATGGSGGYLKSGWTGSRCDQYRGWGGGGGRWLVTAAAVVEAASPAVPEVEAAAATAGLEAAWPRPVSRVHTE